MKTKEELLAKRVKVIASYPDSNYLIGEIIYLNDYSVYERKIFAPYPHLFRELKWWEERDPSDLPEYLMTSAANGRQARVYKVKEYKANGAIADFDDGTWTNTDKWEPADESEYLQFNPTNP